MRTSISLLLVTVKEMSHSVMVSPGGIKESNRTLSILSSIISLGEGGESAAPMRKSSPAFRFFRGVALRGRRESRASLQMGTSPLSAPGVLIDVDVRARCSPPEKPKYAGRQDFRVEQASPPSPLQRRRVHYSGPLLATGGVGEVISIRKGVIASSK